jgi:uncharacterized protein (TIGR00297 family)
VATAAAILFGITVHPMFIAMFLGSVATAAADTVAGEIGMTGGKPYLITTWEPVPAGTNGGVSLVGECAGFASAEIDPRLKTQDTGLLRKQPLRHKDTKPSFLVP